MKNKEDYPMILTVEHIQEILHIGRRKAYQLMKQEGFPCVRVGPKLKRVNRDAFFKWIERESGYESDNN